MKKYRFVIWGVGLFLGLALSATIHVFAIREYRMRQLMIVKIIRIPSVRLSLLPLRVIIFRQCVMQNPFN